MQKTLLRLCGFVVALAFVFAASPKAHADSLTYDLSASFDNGVSLSGWANWSSFSGVTAYSLNLDNSSDTAQCSSSFLGCSGVLSTFSSSEGLELLAGFLNPFGSSLSLLGPKDLRPLLSTSDVTWTVAAPENAELPLLAFGLLVLGFIAYRSPRLNRQLQW